MNILWITNIPIGDIEKKLGTKGGVWMDAMLTQMLKSDENKYCIVTSWNVREVEAFSVGRVKYYLVPGGHPVQYTRDANIARAEWAKIFSDEKPDVIQVWGTEYSHAIPALETAKEMGIPSVIYIQGIMEAIARFATGLAPLKTMLRYTTLRDVYRGQLWAFQNKWFAKRARAEKRLIELSGSVVVENNWAEMFCKTINPELKVFRIPLNINEAFYSECWSVDGMQPHTIICNAAGPAYKGIHVLLQALVLIRERFPDVKLYIPGRSMLVGRNFWSRQKMPGYYSYITDFINKYHLNDNVVFTGYLSQEELARKLSVTNVFVLASSIENHSSSLKEAMAVGIPAVASQVGGIPEYFTYGECGFSYRYEEYECLAGYVCRLFEDDELCKRFSSASRNRAREIGDDEITQCILSMYQALDRRKD